jgi:uncharacterized RDD family membrane protein YckC
MTIQQSQREPMVIQSPAATELARHYGDYAGSITRLIAFIIDALIVTTAIGIIAFVSRFLGDFLHVQGGTLRLLQLVTVAISVLFQIGYFVGLWQLAGMTIGKHIMGLIVVAEDGGRVTFGKAIRRYVGYYISAILMLGYIWILLDPRRQGWHDKFAKTLVLYDWPEQLLLADRAVDVHADASLDVKTEMPQKESARRRRLRRPSASQPTPAANADANATADVTALTTAK